MNLSEIRDRVVEYTGRNDLIETSGADRGMNDRINEAIAYLDTITYNQYTPKRYMKDISAGTRYLDLAHINSLDNAWLKSSTGVRRLKIIRNTALLYSLYPEGIASLSSGVAGYIYVEQAHWAPPLSRLSLNTIESDYVEDGSKIPLRVLGYASSRLHILPPSSEDVTIEIEGIFRTLPLEADHESNFWTATHPRAVIIATAIMLEQELRNSEGVKDHELALASIVNGINRSYVLSTMSGSTGEMNG